MMRLPRSIRTYGQAALLLEWEARIYPSINQSVHQYARAISLHPGVAECVPAYSSLLVRFLPPKITAYQLKEFIYGLKLSSERAKEGMLHHLPVCYHPEVAPDLDHATNTLSITPAQLVDLHTGPTYLVYQLGFLPGFGFLGITDDRLSIARKKNPRRSVPAGSVGLAGRQTGVYPTSSPGGWQLIGRCPLALVRPGVDPIRLRPGDQVKFNPVTLEDYFELRKQPMEGWPAR
jgi:KipI family sensor histidine kinase inhibitor